MRESGESFFKAREIVTQGRSGIEVGKNKGNCRRNNFQNGIEDPPAQSPDEAREASKPLGPCAECKRAPKTQWSREIIF